MKIRHHHATVNKKQRDETNFDRTKGRAIPSRTTTKREGEGEQCSVEQ
jgi:hypothetical protein